MELIRRIYFHAAKGNFTVRISYFPGSENVVADALSRFQMGRFRTLVPTANVLPEVVDTNLVELQRSLLQQNDEKTESLTSELNDCTVPIWLQAPEEHIEPELEDSFLFA